MICATRNQQLKKCFWIWGFACLTSGDFRVSQAYAEQPGNNTDKSDGENRIITSINSSENLYGGKTMIARTTVKVTTDTIPQLK